MTPDNELILARFKNWEEIFPDPAEADRQYLGLLAELRDEYSSNQTLSIEKVEINPQTGLPATIFEKTFGGYARIERLPGGNVRYEFNNSREVHIAEVVPQVGNKDHGETITEIVGLQAQVASAIVESSDPDDRLDLDLMLFYIKGKPAIAEWEEYMLNNHKLPQRVGFKIYPDSNLSAARDRVKK